MAENNGSSNTAVIAILVIVLAAGILYFMGVFTPTGERAMEKPATSTEAPTAPQTAPVPNP